MVSDRREIRCQDKISFEKRQQTNDVNYFAGPAIGALGPAGRYQFRTRFDHTS
jgi:hypothetical protein